MKQLTVLFLFLVPISGLQAQTESYTTTLKKYIEVSGSMQSFKSAIGSMMTSFKNMKSGVPDEFWKDIESEFSGTSIDELVSLLSPVYKKYLSESDLMEIIKFYESPIGRKLSANSTGITMDSMQAGKIWGQSVGEKVMARLKEKGY